jgi:antitoxin component YwqK of YwqJK toxin-antitoxin module
MAHPVRFPGKIWAGALLLLAGCTATEESLPLFNGAHLQLEVANGLMMQHGAPFTGIVYSLQENEKDTAEVVSFWQGREDGNWKKFYSGGRLASTRFFKRGQKTGDYRAWWPNGRPQLLYHFENGEYNGVCREWNEKGQLVKEMQYKNGYEDGPQKQFYDDGKIRSNYIMVDGKRYGLLGTKNCVNVTDSLFKK